MSNLVIVAIPAEDDYVWKLSSEKIPHCTLLFLGDTNSISVDASQKITQFVEHAVNITDMGPFGLDVDRRDTLGVDEADVLFFRKGWAFNRLQRFRAQLLQDNNIKTAYDSSDQFSEWQPHLTMGYPPTPAKEDKRDYPGIHWVQFDRIAVWFGDFTGPEFRLQYNYDADMEVCMSDIRHPGAAVVADILHIDAETTTTRIDVVADSITLAETFSSEFLTHHGIKGMRWGKRTTRPAPSAVPASAMSVVPHGSKKKTIVKVDGGENHPAHEDAIRVAQATAKLKNSGPAALSNQELRDVAQRKQLEQQATRLTQSESRRFVSNLLRQQGQQSANRFVTKKVQEQVA